MHPVKHSPCHTQVQSGPQVFPTIELSLLELYTTDVSGDPLLTVIFGSVEGVLLHFTLGLLNYVASCT